VALLDERRRYDWTYGILALLAVIGATTSLTYSASWLVPVVRGILFSIISFLALGAVLNFFSGEPR
jgi:hypothetical protein